MDRVQIIDNSKQFKDAKDAAIARALEVIGLEAEKYAKLECPVDTGNLRNSISHETEDSTETVYIGTNVEYAPYVEMGTVRTKAQPFLRPAVENHQNEYIRLAKEELRRG